ncbi:hypothetical protein BS17DRAFT_766740 [Gyrodon lividus]|nr:hypothetical protein BS17DRAFT_766740 [Gyrodon lividus]
MIRAFFGDHISEFLMLNRVLSTRIYNQALYMTLLQQLVRVLFSPGDILLLANNNQHENKRTGWPVALETVFDLGAANEIKGADFMTKIRIFQPGNHSQIPVRPHCVLTGQCLIQLVVEKTPDCHKRGARIALSRYFEIECAHLNKMMTIKEELTSMEEPVSDKDFFNMVYVSLPKSYNSVLYSISMSMSLHSQQITSAELIRVILNADDHSVMQSGGKLKSDNNAAFTAGSSKKGKGQKLKPTIICHNCGWEGHKSSSCWEESGGKVGKAPKGWKPRGKKKGWH